MPVFLAHGALSSWLGDSPGLAAGQKLKEKNVAALGTVKIDQLLPRWARGWLGDDPGEHQTY